MKVIKPVLHFKFNFDKFIATIALFAKSIKGDLTKLKICKLLYYADKHHLIRHGMPIIGDRYVHLQRGPVPSMALDILDDFSDVSMPVCDDSILYKLKEFIKVKKTLLSEHLIFSLVKDPDIEVLAESEIESIENTINTYGNMSAGQLIDATHKESPWLKTTQTATIDYRLFFDNEPEANPTALEYLESLCDRHEISLSLE